MTAIHIGSYTRALAEFAQSMELGGVPAEVKHETLRILVDCVGCAVAGLAAPGAQIAIDLVKDERGPLQATVVGNGRVSLAPAAFANTIAINALDFDVYGPEGHVAPIAVAVALAVGDALDASGAEVLASLVAGLEVGGHIGAALRRPGMGGNRQLGPTRGHGNVAFAAAATAGRLLGLTREQMHHAFGIAGYSATVPTLRKFFASSNLPMTKYDHLGLMSQNGIQAALLAQRGFTGDLEVLEGDIGFWRFAGALGCDWDALIPPSASSLPPGGEKKSEGGGQWIIPQVSYKHYPATLYTNPSIHLVGQLAKEHRLAPDAIDRIEVRSSRGVETPPRQEVRHYLDAWTNAAYTIAAGLFEVRPWRSWQEPRSFQRPDLLAFTRKVQFGPLREGEVTSRGNYWERWAPVRVTIEAQGRVFEGGRDHLLLMDDQELVAKFQDNVGGYLAEPDARQLERRCWELEGLRSVRELTGLLGAARLHEAGR